MSFFKTYWSVHENADPGELNPGSLLKGIIPIDIERQQTARVNFVLP